MSSPPTGDGYRLDVHTAATGVDRQVVVRVDEAGLRLGDRELPAEELFWTARRAGLLMLFGEGETLALRGDRETLDTLAARLERWPDGATGRGELLRRIPDQEVLFTAATAAAGRVDDEAVRGLHVAVCTRRALHLFAGPRQVCFRWPADDSGVREHEGRPAVHLRREDDHLTLHYLYPEERRALLEASSSSPAGPEGALELFTQQEVAPPPQAEIPELSVAAGSLQPAAEEASDEVPDGLRQEASLGPHFFETHFLELGEVALGPLLLRKSAAGGAQSLRRAVEALDARELQEDTRAAVTRSVNRLVTVYGDELERLRSAKRAPGRLREELGLSADERDGLSARVHAPFDRLAPRFRRLEEVQERLSTRLRDLAEGPPGERDGGLQEVADRWRSALRQLDRGYESAWQEALEEIRATWTSTLLPRLARVGSMSRRRIPEWAQLVLIGAGTLAVVATLALLIFR